MIFHFKTMLLQLGVKSKDGLTIIYYEASIDVLPGNKEMSVGLLENLYRGPLNVKTLLE